MDIETALKFSSESDEVSGPILEGLMDLAQGNVIVFKTFDEFNRYCDDMFQKAKNEALESQDLILQEVIMEKNRSKKIIPNPNLSLNKNHSQENQEKYSWVTTL